MFINNRSVLDLFAIVHLPIHDGSKESIKLSANLHGEKVKVIGFAEEGKLKVQRVNQNDVPEKDEFEIHVFDLIFDNNTQAAL